MMIFSRAPRRPRQFPAAHHHRQLAHHSPEPLLPPPAVRGGRPGRHGLAGENRQSLEGYLWPSVSWGSLKHDVYIQSAMCCISMDSSRRALQTNGKLFSNFEFIFELLAKNE